MYSTLYTPSLASIFRFEFQITKDDAGIISIQANCERFLNVCFVARRCDGSALSDVFLKERQSGSVIIEVANRRQLWKQKKEQQHRQREPNEKLGMLCVLFYLSSVIFFLYLPQYCPFVHYHSTLPLCFCICSLWMTACILWTVSMKFSWCTPIRTDAMDNGIYYLAFCRKETQLSILTFPLIQRIKEFSLILVAFFCFWFANACVPTSITLILHSN